jgi:hypothetical protein
MDVTTVLHRFAHQGHREFSSIWLACELKLLRIATPSVALAISPTVFRLMLILKREMCDSRHLSHLMA